MPSNTVSHCTCPRYPIGLPQSGQAFISQSCIQKAKPPTEELPPNQRHKKMGLRIALFSKLLSAFPVFKTHEIPFHRHTPQGKICSARSSPMSSFCNSAIIAFMICSGASLYFAGFHLHTEYKDRQSKLFCRIGDMQVG